MVLSLPWVLSSNMFLSAVGFVTAKQVMETEVMRQMFIKARRFGIDLNKRTTKRDAHGELVRPINGIEIPESQGAVVATVYIVVLSIFIPFAFVGHDDDFPHARLSEYLAALLSITLSAFMGFADDVLDLRWKHKIPLPILANLPLLLVYHASGGATGVAVPEQLQGWLGTGYIELSLFFYVFLLGLVLVTTHSINILAGVNGLEVGQSIVIAAAVCVLNAIQLIRGISRDADAEIRDEVVLAHHLQSLLLSIPFLTTSLALAWLNWWPARVFVGDTYTYFAGGTLATVSIVGHFSKTMVLLLIPQILNAIYSIPQLFRLVDCPRHRMPAFDAERNEVKNSFFELHPDRLSKGGRITFWILRTFRLARVLPADESGVVQISNLTLINFFLFKFGQCREDALCTRLLIFQGLCAVFAFTIRFGLAGVFFAVVR